LWNNDLCGDAFRLKMRATFAVIPAILQICRENAVHEGSTSIHRPSSPTRSMTPPWECAVRTAQRVARGDRSAHIVGGGIVIVSGNNVAGLESWPRFIGRQLSIDDASHTVR
jgi:hypothetical protein